MKMEEHPQRVRTYYDKNNRWFNMFGQTGKTGNIHAQIWGEGVTNARQASHFINRQVLKYLQSLDHPEPRIVDLGCGVGGTLRYLVHHLEQPARLFGITISEVQAKKARAVLADQAQMQLDIQQGDFHELTTTRLSDIDLAYAIEAFAHSNLPGVFFNQVSHVLRPHGLLLLADTVPNRSLEELPAASRRSWESYQTCWGAGNTLPLADLIQLAQNAGLTMLEAHNYTHQLAKGRKQDHLIAFLQRIFGNGMMWHPYLRSLKGGHAVQEGFRDGWLDYQLIIFKKMTL